MKVYLAIEFEDEGREVVLDVCSSQQLAAAVIDFAVASGVDRGCTKIEPREVNSAYERIADEEHLFLVRFGMGNVDIKQTDDLSGFTRHPEGYPVLNGPLMGGYVVSVWARDMSEALTYAETKRQSS